MKEKRKIFLKNLEIEFYSANIEKCLKMFENKKIERTFL